MWDTWNQVFGGNVRAEALTAVGRLSEAAESASAALTLALETDHYWGAADAQRRIGEAALAAGDLDTARAFLLAALPYMRKTMPRPDTARCLAGLGRIALRQGSHTQAREHLADSLQVGLRAGSRAAIADTLLGFAELLTAAGSLDRAIQLAAAATAQCAAVRRPPPPEAERYRDAAQALGEPQATSLWADGLKLTSHGAAQLALSPE
jgi:tetratricopeptide (TPR) repeat protein